MAKKKAVFDESSFELSDDMMSGLGSWFDAPSVPPAAQPTESGGSDILRGLGNSFKQLPQLGYGLVAGAGAAVESAFGEGGVGTGLKKWGVENYVESEKGIQATSKQTDSLSYSWDRAKEGDIGALVDWLQYGIGYGGGQALQAIASGGIGAFAGKATLKGVAESLAEGMVKKEMTNIAEDYAKKNLGAQLAEDQVKKLAVSNVAAKIGANVGIGSQAFGMEGGEIMGDLAKTSVDENRTLSGAEIAKGFGATLAAGGLEFITDKLGVDLALGKSRIIKAADGMAGISGKAARAATGFATQAPMEGATEYLQTGLEEWGKGKEENIFPLNQSEEAQRQAFDAAGLGFAGAAGPAVVGGAISSPRREVTPADIGQAETGDEARALFEQANEASRQNAAEINLASTNLNSVLDQQRRLDEAINAVVTTPYTNEADLPMVGMAQPTQAPSGEIVTDSLPEANPEATIQSPERQITPAIIDLANIVSEMQDPVQREQALSRLSGPQRTAVETVMRSADPSVPAGLAVEQASRPFTPDLTVTQPRALNETRDQVAAADAANTEITQTGGVRYSEGRGISAKIGEMNSDQMTNDQLQEVISNPDTHTHTRRAAQEVLQSRQIPTTEGAVNGSQADQAQQAEVPQMQGSPQSGTPVREVRPELLPFAARNGQLTRAKAQAIKAIGRLTGTKVRFFNDPNKAEGQYDPDRNAGEVWINVAHGNLGLRRVFGHEVTHQLRTQHPKAWASIQSVVGAKATNEVLTKMYRDYFGSEGHAEKIAALEQVNQVIETEEFQKKHGSLSRAEQERIALDQFLNQSPEAIGYKNPNKTIRDMLMDEMISDLGGNRFGETEFWDEVFSDIIQKEGTEAGKTIIQKIMQAMKDLLVKMSALLDDPNFEIEKGFSKEDIAKIRTAMAQAYAQMIQAQRGKADIEQTEYQEETLDGESGLRKEASARVRRSVAELVDAAKSQETWRTWYQRHEDTLKDIFGEDADLFQKLLSATSQATGVKGNVTLALKAYDQLLSGHEFTGYLPAVIKNLQRIRDSEKLSGAKISQYGEANEGNKDAIAVDRHIAMLFFDTKSPTPRQIEAAKARIRTIAKRLNWEPRQVQAALWAYNQVRLGTDPEKVESYDRILEARRTEVAALRAKLGRGEAGSVQSDGETRGGVESGQGGLEGPTLQDAVKFRSQVNELNSQHEKKFSHARPDQKVDPSKVPPFKFSDHVGRAIFATIADRTIAGGAYTGIDGSVTDAVPQQGGPGFPFLSRNWEKLVIWASKGKAIVSKKTNLISKHGRPLMAVSLGALNMHSSNDTVTIAYFKTLEAYIRDGRIQREDLVSATDQIRLLKLPNKKNHNVDELAKFPGFNDLAALDKFVSGASFKARAAIIEELGKARSKKLNLPPTDKLLRKMLDPEYAGHGHFDTVLILEPHDEETFVKLGNEGTDPHLSYTYGVRGKVVGKLDTPVNAREIWADWFRSKFKEKWAEKDLMAKVYRGEATVEDLVATVDRDDYEDTSKWKEAQKSVVGQYEGIIKNKAKLNTLLSGDYTSLISLDRSFSMAMPAIEITQQMATRLDRLASGPSINQATAQAALDFIDGVWATSRDGVNKGGVKPTEFAREIQLSEYSATLTQYSAEDLKKAIKSGSMTLYQLGGNFDNGGHRIQFALKKGAPDLYGLESLPGVTDNEVSLVAVVNNEPGIKGIAGPAILTKAIEEGATFLDCFAHASTKYPNGFLPTLYGEYGFEEVGRTKFDVQYLTPDHKYAWGLDGWKEGDPLPDIVFMKWKGNESDRQGIAKRYVDRGAEGLFSGRVSPNPRAVETEFLGDGGTETEEGRTSADGRRVAGVQGTGNGTSLASRAHATIRTAQSLNAEQRANLGVERRPDGPRSKGVGSSAAGEVKASESRPGTVEGLGVHYSKAQQKALVSSFFGTGLKGAELERVRSSEDKRIQHRIYFYMNTGRGINPEFGVGPHAHTANLTNLYDATADALDLAVGRTANEFESAVLDVGFDGYMDQQSGIAVMLGQRVVPVEYQGLGTKPAAPQAGKAEASDYKKLQQKVMANRSLPDGEADGAYWKRMMKAVMPDVDVSHLNDDEKYFKSALVKRPKNSDKVASFPEKVGARETAVASEFRAIDPNSPQFNQWFRNSQIANAFGEPVVMYHGTARDIKSFRPKQAGAIFLTYDPDFAASFSNASADWKRRHRKYDGVGENIVPVYVSAQNPFDYENPAHIAEIEKEFGKRFVVNQQVAGEVVEREVSIEDIKEGSWSAIESDEIQDFIKMRHDGFWVKEGPEKNLGVYQPTQVKSAISNTGEFSDENADIRYSQPRNQPWYYSALEQGLRDKVPAKAKTQPAAQWKLFLASPEKIGAKKEEIEWSGLLDFLGAKDPKAKVTSEELADWVANNGVKVNDVVLQSNDIDPEDADVLIENYNFRHRTQYSLEFDKKTGNYEVISVDDGELVTVSKGKRVKDVLSEADIGVPDGPAKFEQYSLPGGENYKELLITLPPKLETKQQTYQEWVADGMQGEWSSKGVTSEAAKFQSSHFDQPNILAHIRMNERTDADGAKILFLEELQSDWSDYVPKKGKKPVEYKVDLDLEKKQWFIHPVTNKDDRTYVESADRAHKLAEKANKELSKTAPPGPFVTDDSYIALAMKRAIAYAVDHGFDKVAWINGQQAHERFPKGNDGESTEVGMKTAYDQKLPSAAKKLGADVVMVDIGIAKFDPAKIYQYDEDLWTHPDIEEGFRTKKEVEKFLTPMSKNPGFTITDKMKEQVGTKGMPLFSLRRAKNGDFSVDDHLVPEIDPWVSNGQLVDLAYVNGKPIRFNVGADNGPGDGFGGVHLVETSRRDSRRPLDKETDDDGENAVRTVVNVLASAAAQLHHQGKKRYALRLPLAGVTLMVDDRGDHYSIVSRLPSDKNKWGNAEWVGRLTFPTTEDAASSAPLSPVGTESPSSNLSGIDAYVSAKWNTSAPKGMSQKTVQVTVKKKRTIAKESPQRRIIGDSGRQYSANQKKAFEESGRDIEVKTTLEKVRQWIARKWQQGLFDQFAPFRNIDKEAYALMRLSKGAAGAFEAFLQHGKLSLRDGTYDSDTSGGVLENVFIPLGKETTDFLYWIAGNRAERLKSEGKENLLSDDSIREFKGLANGQLDFDYTLSNGTKTRSRMAAYMDAHKKFNEANKNVLDMAEQSGLIDKESRQYWEHEFYVPFYRVADEDEQGIRGMGLKGGIVRQEAFKRLKGGEEKLGDLLSNTLMNWHHLIDASAKNRAAVAAVNAAVRVGAATPATGSEKKTVWVMEKGEKKYFRVTDTAVLEAITSLEYAGMRNLVMDVLTAPKHWLTVGVTASPFFKVKNLIRDSIQAIATSDLSYNLPANVIEGWKLSNRDRQEYVSALAGGGLIRFGTMLEGNEAERTRQLVRQGAKEAHVLNDEGKWQAFRDKVEPMIQAYNELGNRGEEINRMSLYNQMIKNGMSHAEASLAARDLMDFSLQGSFNTIRFLSQVVPFFNARMQGMYKLGRATKESRQHMAVVTFTAAMAGLLLFGMAMSDPEKKKKWERREEWDKASYWWFEFGGIEYRIPRPFELGAVAHLAERSVEAMVDSEKDAGKRYAKAIYDSVKNQLSMNPVPQAIKPIIDIYANKDSFTGRPIETMSMQRLDSQNRYTGDTTLLARGASSVVGGMLSPVQMDHLVRAYFGWIGGTSVATADMAARAMSDEPTRPAADWLKVSTGSLLQNDPIGSRYISMVYDQAKEMEEAYATYRDLLKKGKIEEAKEYRAENADELQGYKKVEGVKKQLSMINERIRMIERSDIHPAEKRIRIRALKQRQSEIAEKLSS